MFWVYVLKSKKDGKQYTGFTVDLDRRLAEHNAGRTESTRRRRPFEVIYSEAYEEREQAKKRERFLKSGQGRKELKRILEGTR